MCHVFIVLLNLREGDSIGSHREWEDDPVVPADGAQVAPSLAQRAAPHMLQPPGQHTPVYRHVIDNNYRYITDLYRYRYVKTAPA